MKTPHLKPQLVVDGTVGQQVLGQFNEDLLMACRAHPFQATTKDDVSSLISEIKAPATLGEFVDSLVAFGCGKALPPSIGVEGVPGESRFQEFSPHAEVINTTELVEIFGVPSEDDEHIFQNSVKAISVLVEDFEFGKVPPITFICEIVENGLTCVLFRPRHVFCCACRVCLC